MVGEGLQKDQRVQENQPEGGKELSLSPFTIVIKHHLKTPCIYCLINELSFQLPPSFPRRMLAIWCQMT